MALVSRRTATRTGLSLAALSAVGYGLWPRMDGYRDEVERQLLSSDAGLQELVRMATLAASGHNTQPWTFVSTHSPMVAALADPKGVAVLRNDGGVLTSVPLLTSTLPAHTPNSVRKLFQVNRVETIAAVMHEFVLVPEGRTDYEWLGLLVRAVDLHQSWAAADECRFDAFVGVIPTHDGAVVRTVEAMAPLHPRVVAMVDGDAEGVGYAAALVAAGSPNSGVIIRWANGQMLEDTIGWIIDADASACLPAIQIDNPAATVAELVTRLKSENRAAGGLKKDTSSYEIIAGAIGANEVCCARARSLLNAITDVAKGLNNPLFAADADSPAIRVFQP